MTFRLNYFLLFLLIFFAEILIALYVHDNFIRPHFGDFLVVIMIYCFLRAFLKISVLLACISTLLFAYVVEGLQYVNLIDRLGIRHYHVARIILGSQFEWLDMIAYTLGISLVLFLEKLKARSIHQ